MTTQAQTAIKTAMNEAINEMTQASTIKAPVKPKAKPKATPKAKAPAKPKATPKAKPETKAGPSTITVGDQTFELLADVDVDAVEVEAKAAAEAIDKIASKDGELMDSYMALGRFASDAVKMFRSTKVYGQYLAAKAPASQSLDPALRSNCKWLYEALNVSDADGSDLLHILKVNQISDYKSGNPTVIKREYKKAIKAKADADAKAELAKSAGVDVDDDEAISALEAENASKDAAKVKRATTMAINNLIKYASAQFLSDDDKTAADDALGEIRDCLKEMLNEHKTPASMVEFLAGLHSS